MGNPLGFPMGQKPTDLDRTFPARFMAFPYAPWGTSISVPWFDHVKDMSVGWGGVCRFDLAQRVAQCVALSGPGPAVWMDKGNSGGYHCILVDPVKSLNPKALCGSAGKDPMVFTVFTSKIPCFGHLWTIKFHILFWKWPCHPFVDKSSFVVNTRR